jgi:hypothetical protein
LDQFPKLSVQLSAPDLSLSPTPYTYTFSSRAIIESQIDGTQWIISPKRPGDYVILVKFEVEPRDWHIGEVSANGTGSNTQFGSIPLHVHVETMWFPSDVEVAVLKGLSQIFSFFLTLPLLAMILEPYLKAWVRRRSHGT